jgi:hypothetical protein
VSGLAGGMIETSREVGGALGVAVVATMAIGRADDVLAALGGTRPDAQAVALTEAFARASLVAAIISIFAALAAGLVLRRAEQARDTIDRVEPDVTDAAPAPALQES